MKSITTYIIENSNHNRFSNIVLISPENEILIVHRRERRFKNMWGFPGGLIEEQDNNDSKMASIRELKEETGIELNDNEKSKIEYLTSIVHNNKSISDYWIVAIDSKYENIQLSNEHDSYEWYKYDTNDKEYKWMPNIKEIIKDIKK